MPPGRPNRQAERRQQIVDLAADLFDTKGYHQASMDDLADKVGLAKPTLYHYYRSKQEILAEIHEQYISDMLDRQRQRDGLGLSSPEELLEVMTDIFTFMRTHRGHVRVFFEHQQELPETSKAHIRKLRKELTDWVTKVIADGVESGDFRITQPRVAARALFGMCNWSYHWYGPQSTEEPRDIARSMWEIFMTGIQADREAS